MVLSCSRADVAARSERRTTSIISRRTTDVADVAAVADVASVADVAAVLAVAAVVAVVSLADVVGVADVADVANVMDVTISRRNRSGRSVLATVVSVTFMASATG